MRLALLLPSLDAGGAQRQFVQMAAGLAARGHEILFVTCVPGGPHWDSLAAVAGVRRLSLAPRPRSGRLGIGPRLPALAARLAQELRESRIEIVYSGLHSANLLAWIATLGGRTIPLCWGMRAARQDLGWRQQVPLELCRLASASVGLLIANSAAGLATCRAHGYRPRRAEIVSNGIDVDRFKPDPAGRSLVRAEWGVPDAAGLIGLVARLVPVKDHPTFLAAAARLRTHLPEPVFVLIGGGPAAYRQTLIAEAVRLGLTDCLVWAGERADMARVYSALDVLSLSSASEGFPNVLAEAMACGVPAVATDVGETRSILGELGDVVPPGDPEALATALGRCLSLTPDRRREIGEAGRSRIAAHYGVTAMIARTETLLAETLSAHRRMASPRWVGASSRTIED